MNNIEYTLMRSRRRTLTLTVSGGKVIVKAPYGMPEESILKFISEKRRWLEAKLAEQKTVAERFACVRSGGSLLDAGVEKPVAYGAAKNGETDGGFYLKNQHAVRAYFEKTRGWLLSECLHSFARSMGVSPSDLSLCDFKARWGSCDADGRIKLNWRLTMLPPELRDYVLVHELCHLRELNHSAAFWKIVGLYCPAYRTLRKNLREYSFLTQMYRKSP